MSLLGMVLMINDRGGPYTLVMCLLSAKILLAGKLGYGSTPCLT
jgi:hypothetical protein